MKATKIATTAGIGAAIVAGSMLAVTAASAHYGGNSEERVAELAERFNLDETEVQTYFEEKKAEHQAEREEKRAEHLAELVTEGTLTQAQADQLSAFHEEFRAEVEALRDSGAERDEIKTATEANKAEVEAWANEQGLNLDDIRPEKGEGFGKRGHYKGGFGQDQDDSEES